MSQLSLCIAATHLKLMNQGHPLLPLLLISQVGDCQVEHSVGETKGHNPLHTNGEPGDEIGSEVGKVLITVVVVEVSDLF